VTDLRIDTELLRETGASLRTVADEFEHANNRVEDVGALIGHDGLTDRVRSFARNWDDRRGEMLESIAHLAEAGRVVGETFEQIETDLVDVLAGKPT
jgi:hypothetical protein